MTAGGMTTEERYLFDLHGYLVIEDVLGAGELHELNRLLDDRDLWNRPQGEDLDFDSWQNDEHQMSAGPLHMWDEPFRRLIAHSSIVPYLTDILGSRFRYDHGHAMVMTKGGRPLGLHGGGRPWDNAVAYDVCQGRIHCGLVVVHYALCDVGPSDGGFCALPGSHKSNFACPESFESLTDPGPWVKPVPLRAGSVVLFTEALTHGTLPWTAEHERRALMYRYTPGHMAFVGRYWEDGREHSGGAYPRPCHTDTDDWTPLERRMLEPPYVWERPDTVTE